MTRSPKSQDCRLAPLRTDSSGRANICASYSSSEDFRGSEIDGEPQTNWFEAGSMEVHRESRTGHPIPYEFDEYIDGETPSERVALLEIHFASCPSCRESLRERQSLFNAIDHALSESVTLPNNFTRSVVNNRRSWRQLLRIRTISSAGLLEPADRN